MEITKRDGFHPYFTLYVVDEIESTNTYLKEEFKKYPNRSVLYALKQTNGRGRYHRVWDSNGTVCFSILLKKSHHNEIVAPLAICLALADFGVDAGIKWPNDIYLNNKKLAGILIEDVYMPDYKASIIGIGINLTSKIELNGIGLEGYDIKPYPLIKKVLDYYYILMNKDVEYLIDIYRDSSVVIGKKLIYKNACYTATAIDDKGHLVLTNDITSFSVASDEINLKEALLDENK